MGDWVAVWGNNTEMTTTSSCQLCLLAARATLALRTKMP